jgi:thymidylate synthase
MSTTKRLSSESLALVPSGGSPRSPGLPSSGERSYLRLVQQVLDEGEERDDRTGVGTRSVFGAQVRYDLREGFPLLTTKRVMFSSVVHELLWFLRGSTSVRDLPARIWDEWADEAGEVGPVYGFQWRRWGASYDGWLRYQRRAASYARRTPEQQQALEQAYEQAYEQARGRGQDQAARAGEDAAREAARVLGADYSPHDGMVGEALRLIKEDPGSRRIVVSAWNVSDLGRMRLPPCHLLFQFYVSRGSLDCQVYQRSADLMLGVPFNVASYALLLEMFARECRLAARYLVHTIGDAHVYQNHVEGARLQLSREVLPAPRLVLADKAVDEQRFEDVRIAGYDPHPAIRFEVAV